MEQNWQLDWRNAPRNNQTLPDVGPVSHSSAVGPVSHSSDVGPVSHSSHESHSGLVSHPECVLGSKSQKMLRNLDQMINCDQVDQW